MITLLAAAGYATAFFFAQRSPSLFPSGWYLGTWSAWFGTALVLGGTIFRQWAIRTLGRYFTRQVLVSSDQPVVEDGPYRWVRHPSYTGAVLQATGVGFALGSWPSLACLLAAFLAGFGYRIHVEEKALVAAIGEPYRAYRLRTRRLIPFVW